MINGRTQLIAHFGYPTKDTVTKLNDEMDFQRAMQAYLWSFPAVSNASIQASVFRDLGATYNDMIVFDNFLDTKSVFLTGNTTSRRPSATHPMPNVAPEPVVRT